MVDAERIRKRAEQATPGPWSRHGADVHANDGGPLFTGRDGSAAQRHQADRDAEFVAHARQDVLDLLAAIEDRAVPETGGGGPSDWTP